MKKKAWMKKAAAVTLAAVVLAAGVFAMERPGKAAAQERPVAEVYQDGEEPSSLYVFDGTVVKVKKNKKAQSGTILMKETTGGNEVVFRYSRDTVLELEKKELKKGTRLNVLYNGIMTRSLPPQAFAQEIRLYKKTDSYRGTITKLTKKGKDTTATLVREAGTPYADTLTVLLTKETKTNLAAGEKFQKGNYIEVFYEIPGSKKGKPKALTAQKLLDAQMCVYTGTLLEIRKDTEKEGKGILVMKDEINEEFLFHYDAQTLFKTPLDELKPGDKLSIYNRGAVMLSLPPQCGALEVSIYQE